MASRNLIQIIVQGVDQNASKTASKVKTAYNGMGTAVEKQQGRMGALNERFLAFSGLAIGAGAATGRYTSAVGKAVDESNRYENAMAGLNTIAKYFKQDQDAAKKAAQDLASDGLMTVTESATGLKNLLASGFSLPQAIKLMERFKDSAAFNRQAALGFGEAISGATEGIKNGNSILVDNAGVTKNLSRILEEAGYSAQDLNKATSDNNIRQALYKGLLKETNPMVGDAKLLAQQFAGEQAKLAAETDKTQQKIGQSLQPKLAELIRTVRPVVASIGEWVEKNPELASTLIVTTGAVLGVLTAIGLLGLAVSTLSTAFTALGITSAAVAAKNAVVWLASNGSVIASNLLMRASFLLTWAKASASAVASAATSNAAWASAAGSIGGKFAVLKRTLSAPIAVTVVAGAALLALDAILNKAKEVHDTFDQLDNQVAAETKSSIDMMKSARKRYDKGEITYKQFRSLVGIAARATGGPVQAGQPYIVGEHEPELFVPSQSGQILNQQQIREAGIGGGQQISVTQHIYNQTDLTTSMRDIGWYLRSAA